VLAGGSPELTQAIVAAVIKEGHFARHIQRMRKLYAERREATAAGLENVLGKHMRIDSQARRNALDLAAERPTVRPSACCAYASRRAVRGSIVGLDDGYRWSLGLAGGSDGGQRERLSSRGPRQRSATAAVLDGCVLKTERSWPRTHGGSWTFQCGPRCSTLEAVD
jgi:hypothetical protein